MKGIKSLSGILMLSSLASGLVTLILYLFTGVTAFTPKLSTPMIIFLIVGLVLGAVSLFIPKFSKQIKYLVYIAFLFAMLMYISTQITYIANIFVAIDGTSFSASFIITFILVIASFVLALISANKEKDLLEGEEEN